MTPDNRSLVEFFFDYGSPFSYLANSQLPGIAARTGASIVYRPMLLGAVLKATGNSSPMAVPAKGRYMSRDLERWAKRYGVAFQRNPFPFLGNTLRLMRGAVASQKLGVFDRYHPAVFSAAWGNPLDLGDEKIFQAVLLGAGIDAGELLRSIDDQSTKDKLRQATELAVERGVFGAPAFFVGGELFWGNDRLDFVERALRASASSEPAIADAGGRP
jgi:2-hydroxychromene-2-carboxylate isomerase